jgi:hypothetical protein
MRKVSEYETHAAECRKMAAQMKDPEQKAQLEEMAKTWDMMAGVRKKQLVMHGKKPGEPTPLDDASGNGDGA